MNDESNNRNLEAFNIAVSEILKKGLGGEIVSSEDENTTHCSLSLPLDK